MAALDTEGALRALSGQRRASPVPVTGARHGETPIAWDAASRALFVWDRTVPGDLVRIDLETGRRETRLRIAPLDPAGVIYGHLVTTTDASHYLVRFRRMLSSLVLVEGRP